MRLQYVDPGGLGDLRTVGYRLDAEGDGVEIERLGGLGAAGILTKPFDPRTLPADVRALLDARVNP